MEVPVDCDTIYGGTVASDECDYDPAWDPTPMIIEMSAIAAEATAMSDAANYEAMQADAEFADVGGVSPDCVYEQAVLASFLVATVWAAGSTIGYAVMRQYKKAAFASWGTWVTFTEYANAFDEYVGCMNEAKTMAKIRRNGA